MSAEARSGLWNLFGTTLDVVLVDDMHAIVAEGARLRILSRNSQVSPRDYFQFVRHIRDKGFDADDLRLIATVSDDVADDR